MIVSISIENFALIEKLQLSIKEGFTVITGETGAGKSIILGALGLVLGKRADLSQLKVKDEKCVIEAVFKINAYHLEAFFQENDLDYEEETIIRREILPSGKSRAFINDTPVNLSELQILSDFLLDIHSQHQTQELFQDQIQLKIIDAIANNSDLLLAYQKELNNYKKNSVALKVILRELQELEKEKDYNNFLLDELLAANLTNVNQTELEEDFEINSNIDLIKESLNQFNSITSDENYGTVNSIKEAKTQLHKITSFSKEYHNLLERFTSISIELDDIIDEAEKLQDAIVVQPELLETINNKLQLLYSLQKKHNVSSVSELLDIQNSLDNKVVSLEEFYEKSKKLETIIANSELQLKEISKKLHKNRAEATPKLVKQLEINLANLGMQNSRFKIDLEETTSFLENGMDTISFLFSANKGGDFGMLKKVASGGELSRIMLTIKYILAQYSSLPTILFDEIDTGVSGEIATKMGVMMKEMSNNMQVISITHLPQVASQGNSHLKVYKSQTNTDTITNVEMLTKENRVLEIAQMLSGASITDASIINAKELLKQ